jgi:hypothetical protein
MVSQMEVRTPPPADLARVRVTIRNPITGKSKSLTIYGVNEVQAAQEIRRLIRSDPPVRATIEANPELSPEVEPVGA